MARLIFVLSVTFSNFHSAFVASNIRHNESPLVFALLHYSPVLGDIEKNGETILSAMSMAKANGAEWLVTPELALTGYYFQKEIGTAWINKGPDKTVELIQAKAKTLELGVLLSHLERPKGLEKSIFNTLFVITPQGEIVARHNKINTIPKSEDWATKGSNPTLTSISGYRTGLLICADAWPERHANELKEMGAELFISTANWGPGIYGPGETWEKRSKETEAPWIVNNRTGVDKTLDLRKAKSVVSSKGKRIYEFSSESNSLILLYFNRTRSSPEFVKARTLAIKSPL